MLRANVLPGSRPLVRLEGLDNIHEGLAKGRGVILWVTVSACSSLASKVALKEAGIEVIHVSRPTHGFSGSQFGRRFLNPLWARIEERFLKERIVLEERTTVTVMRRLVSRLKANGVLTITVSPDSLQQGQAPLFSGYLPVATGPAHLATMTGATLLPLFCIRDGEVIRVLVGEPLESPSGASKAPEKALIEAYGVALQDFVHQHPSSWYSWYSFPPGIWQAADSHTDA